MLWTKTELPGADHTLRVPITNSGPCFTVGGFLKALEAADLREGFDLDSLKIELTWGELARIFGPVTVTTGTYEEVWGDDDDS